MQEGKKFEQDIKNSFDNKGLYILRLKDSSGSYSNNEKSRFTSTNPCDSISYNIYNKNMLYLECKSTNSASLPFINIKKHQIDEMKKASDEFSYIDAYFLINFRKNEETYAVNVDYIHSFYYSINEFNKENRKSIPRKFCQKYGIILESTKKKTRYSYNIEKFMKDII